MVLIAVYIFLSAFIILIISSTSLSAANNMYKLMCFKCNMPHECSNGFCYGDYCVKSISGNHYVSKGCENKSSSYLSVYARGISERSESNGAATDIGCVETDLFGIPNTVCYCNDADYCNISNAIKIVKIIGFIVALNIFLFI